MKTKSIVNLVFGIGILVSLVLEPVNTYATECRSFADDLAPYQAVMDEINQEYGLNFWFITPEESRELNLPLTRVENLGTVEEYEAGLRAEAENVARQNAYAEAAAARAASQPGRHYVNPEVIIETIVDGDKIGTRFQIVESDCDAIQNTRAVYTVYYEKAYFNGHKPAVRAVISNGNGYWQWLSVSDYFSYYYQGTYPQFRGSSIKSSGFTDNSRTRYVTFNGTYYASFLSAGVAATRYEEFGAGSAANFAGL
jgi:hypothetical protein